VNGHALPEGHPRTNHTVCFLLSAVEHIYDYMQLGMFVIVCFRTISFDASPKTSS
jgi:hypothetical protein